MNITVDLKDVDGNPLELGDTIELFDWGQVSNRSLGVATLIFDTDEGRINTDPILVDDPYDFWRKAMPRCRLVAKAVS